MRSPAAVDFVRAIKRMTRGGELVVSTLEVEEVVEDEWIIVDMQKKIRLGSIVKRLQKISDKRTISMCMSNASFASKI